MPFKRIKGVRFADLASLVKSKYFITDLSNAVLLIWLTVLLVLVSFFNCFHLLFVFSSPEPKAHR